MLEAGKVQVPPRRATGRWPDEFKAIAKIALADDAQLLEALEFGVWGCGVIGTTLLMPPL